MQWLKTAKIGRLRPLDNNKKARSIQMQWLKTIKISIIKIEQMEIL
jgi:hypothetical protein